MHSSALYLIASALAITTVASFSSETEFWIRKLLNKLKITAEHHAGAGYPPIEQDVTFWCFKPHESVLKQVQLNDYDVGSKLDFSRPVNFLIHGFLAGVLEDNMHLEGSVPHEDIVNERHQVGWMGRTAIDWAHFGDCNVCVVDWSRLASYEYSLTAHKHTKMVAQAISNFIEFLTPYGLNIEDVSIAGHSMGAHIAGFVGQTFSGAISAIYGMDPAGPEFSAPKDFGIDGRLDPTDAQYVQCIYTNQGGLGTALLLAHGNFVMNSGVYQPGCAGKIACSHARAVEYFAESLNPKHRLDEFDQIGIHSARRPGNYFVRTNGSPPFARHIEDN